MFMDHEDEEDSEEKKDVGVTWYRPEQWERLRELAVDPEIIENTYEEWALMAEEKMGELLRAGIEVWKTPVAVEEFRAWCERQRLPLNGYARARFVAQKLHEMERQKRN
ncbi:MAG: hypothetical protein LAO31_06745 [Acidobacteriia bacterium]|nr:hypothetical protein [Terriglobia bacterium]